MSRDILQQQSLHDYDKRAEQFSRIRALILKVVTARPGLTVEDLSKEFLLRFGFLPRVDNRVRELRAVGWVETRRETDGLLHVYPKQEEKP